MMDERIWKIMQKRLGYTDEELEEFKANPRNEHALSKANELSTTRFVVEIIDSHGCNSRHKKGDLIHFDGYGNLLKENAPEKLCIFLLGSLQTLIFSAQELIYAGVDPNEMRFNTVGCIDVGLQCNGWGKVAMRLKSIKV
jgi:hypothetical protein